ncbi:BTAD domain-containing putative transcriptional regulator [Streptomyces sp. NPDC014656]|uniref:BTAD domain-containing putative transcriptional regulator n=1 Tax=Streptomyces sp. NPDC014656 TaxID=3364878 RepID=UPI00370079DB
MEVLDDGRPVGLGGAKQRATLGFLLLHPNKVVPTSRLLSALWEGDEAPVTARKILQNAVYGLRGALASGRGANGPAAPALLTRPPGYMMRVDPGQVDLHHFHALAGRGRDRLAAGAPEAAVALLRDALALWRGPALADLVEKDVAWPELAAVESARLDAMEDYVEAQLACGRHHGILAELEAMVRAEPLRERGCGQLMLALYRCGRQADALSVYSRVRAVLVESLGLEPGHGLQALQQRILTQDPSLLLPRAPARPGAAEDGGARDRLVLAPAAPGRPAGGRESGERGTAGGRTAEGRAADGRTAGRGADGRGAEGRGPGTERRQVSVVSVRTRIASSLGGGAGDRELDDLLDGAELLVREQIERFGGVVTAAIGSISVGLFGLEAPRPDDAHQDDARRAVLAALAIRDVLDVPDPADTGTERSTVHVVVTTGEVMLRRRGRDAVPAVFGDILDESQELLCESPAGEVRVSDEVHRASEHTVRYRRSDAHALEWQAVAVRDDGRGGTGGGELSVELDVLRGLVKRTRQRAVPHLVTVIGEPGTGKTRLLAELRRSVTEEADGPLVLSARASGSPGESPLAVPGRLLAAYCGTGPEDSPEAVRAALEHASRDLYRSEAVRERRLPLLWPLLDPGGEPAPGTVRQTEVLDGWREFLLLAVQRRPLVLCLDDLHLSPDMALDAVGDLVESAGEGPLFVIAAARPELLERRPSWAGGKSHTMTVTLARPERITNEQLVEFLLSAVRNESLHRLDGSRAG